eukprot:scpid15663/ scgid3125/ 
MSTFRRYKSTVPAYLHDRPRHVILHCLQREESAQHYCLEDVAAVPSEAENQYTVKSSSGKTHLVTLSEPVCSCEDWHRHGFPCKHMFALFLLSETCSWNSLPEKYRKSPRLCIDVGTTVAQPECDVQQQTPDPASDVPEVVDNNCSDIPRNKTEPQKIRKAAKKVRSALKVLEGQSFICQKEDALLSVHDKLEDLSSYLSSMLPTDSSGLVVPDATSFNLADQFRLKRKVQEHSSTAVPEPSLEACRAKRGKPSIERQLRCRVGVSGDKERQQLIRTQQRQKASCRPGFVELQTVAAVSASTSRSTSLSSAAASVQTPATAHNSLPLNIGTVASSRPGFTELQTVAAVSASTSLPLAPASVQTTAASNVPSTRTVDGLNSLDKCLPPATLTAALTGKIRREVPFVD